MKTLHIASILVVSALAAFACGDDDSSGPAGSAGKASSGGSAGKASTGGSAGKANTGGSAGKTNTGGNSHAGDSSGNDAGATVGGAAGQQAGGAGGAAEPACVDDMVGGAGGAGGDAAGGAAGLEILGTWKESFGADLVITASHWNDGTIQSFDNDSNVVYTQNSCADFNPKKFSKYVYTDPQNDAFYYCTIEYAAETLAAAQASAKVADENDLDGTGCNGFPWSKVTKP